VLTREALKRVRYRLTAWLRSPCSARRAVRPSVSVVMSSPFPGQANKTPSLALTECHGWREALGPRRSVSPHPAAVANPRPGPVRHPPDQQRRHRGGEPGHREDPQARAWLQDVYPLPTTHPAGRRRHPSLPPSPCLTPKSRKNRPPRQLHPRRLHGGRNLTM
jgi:hypothetical protein